MTGGSPRSSSGMAPTLTRRKTRPAEPRERNALTRKRPTPEQRVGEVGLVGAVELLDQVLAQHLADHLLGVGGREVAGLQLAQAAVDAHPGRRADLAVQVGATALHEGAQEGLDGQRAVGRRHGC